MSRAEFVSIALVVLATTLLLAAPVWPSEAARPEASVVALAEAARGASLPGTDRTAAWRLLVGGPLAIVAGGALLGAGLRLMRTGRTVREAGRQTRVQTFAARKEGQG